MLEKRKGRGGGSGRGSSIVDDWDAPPLIKAQMAFEIIWLCALIYLISTLIKALPNAASRQRQPYILLVVSAIFLAIGLTLHAVVIRIDDITDGMTSLALDSVGRLLWQQPIALITMAGLWVFRQRSQLLIYGKGAKGIPYAGQMWKFVVDWMAVTFCLLFLVLAIIVNAVGYTLYFNDNIGFTDYKNFYNAQAGLSYVPFAFYFILTIIFVVAGFMLNGAFKRQTGHPDVVTRQMLIWVMPWLLIRALYTLIQLIISSKSKGVVNNAYYYSVDLATVIISGACWCMVLYGFIKTVADPAPWDWSHLQAQQPQMAPYGVQGFPAQPGYYPHPSALPPNGPPQGWLGQNGNPQQQVYQQPHTPPQPQA